MESCILGTGVYLPESVIDKSFFSREEGSEYSPELADFFDGCVERRHAGPDETSIEMSKAAARRALACANIDPADIDYILHTGTGADYYSPSDGAFVARDLEMTNATTWSIGACCGAFVFQMMTANNLICSGQAKHVLIIASTNWVNRIIDKSLDYSCLGDGAAAVIVGPSTTRSLLAVHERTFTKWAQHLSNPRGSV